MWPSFLHGQIPQAALFNDEGCSFKPRCSICLSLNPAFYSPHSLHLCGPAYSLTFPGTASLSLERFSSSNCSESKFFFCKMSGVCPTWPAVVHFLCSVPPRAAPGAHRSHPPGSHRPRDTHPEPLNLRPTRCHS